MLWESGLHREFRALLEQAIGVSDQIIAIFIDIRSFSAFSKTTDSADVATFVRHVFRKIIAEYFADATFYKSTGDGLMVVVSYQHSSDVKATIAHVFEKCQEILTAFQNFSADEPRVNFAVPNRIGIGIARGSGCKLESEGKTLDYSGHVLNLAAQFDGLGEAVWNCL